MLPNNPPFTVFLKIIILKDMSCNHAKIERMRQFDIRHITVTVLD